MWHSLGNLWGEEVNTPLLLKTEICDWLEFYDQGGLGSLLGFGQDVISAMSTQGAQLDTALVYRRGTRQIPGVTGRTLTLESAVWIISPR